MTEFNWGILATGNIAGSMASALKLVPDARLYAVASRRQDAAEAFARKWGARHAYGAYAALLEDPDIDIVYVATPNALHTDNVLAALAAGKHVLCEKPLATSLADARACIDAAKTANRFLMEALWTAFFPAMEKARQLLDAGAIGSLHRLSADFVSCRDPVQHPNLFDPKLGGGASLDLGIYPIAAALILAGPFASHSTVVEFGETGVDEMVGIRGMHEGGALSQLSFGFRAELPIALRLEGGNGSIEIPANFHKPRNLILQRREKRLEYVLPALGEGYAHEVMAVQDAIARGDRECTGWSHSHSLAAAGILDDIRGRATARDATG